MTDNDIEIFIEEMDNMGDHWEKDDVKNIYSDKSLDEALEERKTSIAMLDDIIGQLLSL